MEHKQPLQQVVLGDLDSYMQKNETHHQLTLYTKINSRWIKDLNISCNIIKVLEENIGRKISDIPHSNILREMSLKARDIKERINKWDLIKIKSFSMAKENSTNIQRERTVWENICQRYLRQGPDLQNIYRAHTTALQEDKQSN